MDWNIVFFVNSFLLGVGLAMDSFSVSIADALSEPLMRRGKMIGIAATFGGFQALMPLIGWICVHTLLSYFQSFQKFIPWIALALLSYIGGKMLREGIRGEQEGTGGNPVTFGGLMVQGIATAIDALSVGFTIADYDLVMALVAILIIGVVTFCISLVGCLIGKKVGQRLNGKASIVGGIILIGIGLEIFISGIFF